MNYNLKPVALLAQDIQLVIVHNSINNAGDVDEEKVDYLYGNIHRSLPALTELLSEKSRVAVEDAIRGLYVNFEDAKPVALTLFGNIASDPRNHVRSDIL